MNHVRALRSHVRRLAAVAVALVAAAGLSPAPAAGAPVPPSALVHAAAKGGAGPLTVRLTSLSPSTVPKSGPLRMSGTVRNDSKEAWREVNVQAFVSSTPMTTPQELADAAATRYDADVGARLQTTHAFVAVGDLAPGQTRAFSLRVPRSELPIPERPGVYWVGAHALGANKDGRDGVADGRARTFIPLIRARRQRASVALVLPFRERVRRDAAGKLLNPGRWQRLTRPTGRLGRVLRIAESAGAEPLTIVVDPAVLDAVDSVANGSVDPGTPTPSGAPSATPSATPTATPSGNGGAATARPTGSDAASATDWLTRFRALADRKRVLGVGYADPDTAALAERSPGLLDQAATLGAETLQRYGVNADPAAVPADGHLPAGALPTLGADTVVLLDDTAVPGRRTHWQTSSGQPLVVTDAATATGGPGPTPATAALAMRQRIVAEAALRALSGSGAPLVVALPAGWDPGTSWQTADFFRELQVPWLQLTGLDTNPAVPTRARLVYPAARARAQVGPRLVAAAKRVITAAGIFADALTRPDGVAASYTRLALEATSYHSRSDAGTSLAQSLDLARSIRARLTGIRVVGSSFVTMSGGSGSFVVTLVNDLGFPVRVGIKARTDSPALKITPPEAAVLPPRQRTTVRLPAKASDIGVREVQLTPVTRKGYPVGSPITLSVRSSQVSSLIWGVMAAGGALLVVMIVRRAFKRGGLRRENPAP
ncbi:MAG: DUF6049 family protein [Marmoricola sp.]